jgi:hypothetical protein
MSNEWNPAPEKSPVWMEGWEKPIEHLYLLKHEPERAADLDTKVCWVSSIWPNVPDSPEAAIYLGALEWAWSPVHSRLDSYYLSRTDAYWLIYQHYLEDGGEEWTWEWRPYAFSTYFESPDLLAIAYWMIHDLLKIEAESQNLDSFHLISGEGMLTVGHFKMIDQRIW